MDSSRWTAGDSGATPVAKKVTKISILDASAFGASKIIFSHLLRFGASYLNV
jgi:hypothetical protein